MKISAGLLMYRRVEGILQVFLVHPGGPFFRNKDEGAWSIPKGLIEEGEDLLFAARREFHEETGVEPPEEGYIPLGEIQQKGGKRVHAWAFEGDCDPEQIVSNTFQMEWPRGSGRMQEFPEIDRAAFFPLERAKLKINPAQVPLIERLCERLDLASADGS